MHPNCQYNLKLAVNTLIARTEADYPVYFHSDE